MAQKGWKRWLGGSVTGVAVLAVATTGLASPPASAADAGTCPVVPKAPPPSSYYRLSGYRWDPTDTITYKVDVGRLPASQIPARVADAKKAMADADRWTGLRVSYGGTEPTLEAPASHQLVQFDYTARTTPVEASLDFDKDSKQIFSGVVDVALASKTGFGAFDPARPIDSPEGHPLLFGVGTVMGLDTVADTRPEVMNPDVTKARYYESYQGGDERGLWEAGVAGGCTAS